MSLKRQTRGTQIPDDFALSPEMHKFAVQRGIWQDDEEFGHFCDYHRSRGTVFKDWEAAWRNWVRNAVKFNSGIGIVKPEAEIGRGPTGVIVKPEALGRARQRGMG